MTKKYSFRLSFHMLGVSVLVSLSGCHPWRCTFSLFMFITQSEKREEVWKGGKIPQRNVSKEGQSEKKKKNLMEGDGSSVSARFKSWH